MNITLRQLYGFKAVAQCGSFTRAAHQLHTPQPALSLCIRELELELKIRLFDRTTRRVEITAAGREFLASVDKMIGELEFAVRNARDLVDRKRGRVIVAAPPLLAAMIVPNAIADYKSAYPGIDVRVIDTQTDVIIDKVRSGEADCGVGTFPESDELRRQVLVQDALMAWLGPQHAIRRAATLRWSDLADHPIIMLTQNSSIRHLVERAFAARGQQVRPAYEVAHMTTAIMLAEAGLGVAVLPAYVWSFANAFNVSAKSLLDPEVRREIYFIHASERAISPATEGFSRYLRKRANASLPRFMRKASQPE
jgi:DNA-binding transcriptional LysR family regulator